MNEDQARNKIFKACTDAMWEHIALPSTYHKDSLEYFIAHRIGEIYVLDPGLITVYTRTEHLHLDAVDMDNCELIILIAEICLVPQKRDYSFSWASRRGIRRERELPRQPNRWAAIIKEIEEDELPCYTKEHKPKNRSDPRDYEFERYVPGCMPFQDKWVLRNGRPPKDPLGKGFKIIPWDDVESIPI